MFNIKTLKTSHVALKGSTATPTIRSATAKLTMNMLVTFLSLKLLQTAAITRTLPSTTMILITARTARVITISGPDHTTAIYNMLHALSFSFRILQVRLYLIIYSN
jgi:hypothetical protein